MPSERIFPLRMPMALLRSIDAAIHQGLPSREATLAVGALNGLIEAAERSPCEGCAHRTGDDAEPSCSSPVLEALGMPGPRAVELAATAAHCTLRKAR